ncbi:MAG: PAS domain-containing protein [Anaerolineae bacterium]|nr:PAS domain-containing protein [Anaerolineae bacterium]
MGDNNHEQAEAVGGVLRRINQLGAATERLFSRLFINMNQRAKIESEREARLRRKAELEAKINRARLAVAQNRQLKARIQVQQRDIERLDGILATITEGIIMQDLDGKVVFMNNAAHDLLGKYKNFRDTELGQLFDTYHQASALGGEVVPLTEPNKVQVNNRILGAQVAAVGNDKGERIGTVIVLRDVTQEALTDRLRTQFVTALSHELKTPMTAIKGMADVLKHLPPDNKDAMQRPLETLIRNVDVLDRMIVELLDVSELGAGTFDIRHDAVEIEPLLWSVVNGTNPDVKRKRLDVMVMLRDSSALRVNGDEQRLRWAFGHLLQNAVNYTENGGHVLITASIDSQDHRYMRIDVIDDGVGISKKDLPHIFEQFYRGEPRNSQGKLIDPRGLGQGLFIARKVAEAHGGYVSVLKSDVGVGTTITCILPLLQAP